MLLSYYSLGGIVFRRKAALSKELFSQFLGHENDIDEILQKNECPSICLERGVHFDSLLVE